MTKKDIIIKLSGGLDARPVAMLVQVASQFDSSVYIETTDKRVNAKSIMGMMGLGMDEGEQFTVITDGPDEAEAISSIENYLSGETA